MSLLIDSDDIAENEIYDGKYIFKEPIQGFYHLDYQYLESGSMPIIWEGVNNFKWKFNYFNASGVGYTYADSRDAEINFSTLFLDSDDLTAIGADLQSQLRYYMEHDPIYQVDPEAWCTVTVDEANQLIHIQFEEQDIMGFKWNESTFGKLFDKQNLELVDYEQQSNHTLTLDAKKLKKPKLLYCRIEEATQNLNNAETGITSSFVMSTSDDSITNQTLYFRRPTTELNISIYRRSVDVPIPITNRYILMFN